MRARFFVPVLLAVAVGAICCRSSFAAEEADKPKDGRADQGAKANAPVASQPMPVFDLGQLPVGKTIGVVSGNTRVLKALEEPAEFELLDTQLGDFVKQVGEKHKVSVKLDVAALTADGKGAETILNGKISNTTLRSALRLYLGEQGLTSVVENDTLLITTKTAAETKVSTRIYQVHDLIFTPNDPYLRPDFEALIEVISSTVQPESWREAGGTAGEIRRFQGPGVAVLIVQHTDDGHEEVEKLLADLRAAKIPELLEMQKKRLIPPPQQPLPTGTPPVVVSPIPVVGQGTGMGGGF